MPKVVSPWAANALLMLARNQAAENRSPRFLKLAAEARSRIREISPAEAAGAVRRGATLIDVREREEYVRAHIREALHISKGTIEFLVESRQPDYEAEIVVYCGRGNRSALAADSLQRMGYTRVAAIAGGFQAWLKAGYEAWRGSGAADE